MELRFRCAFAPFYIKYEVHLIYVPLNVNDRRDQVAMLQLAIMKLDDRRSRQDGVGGQKVLGPSMIIRRQTATMWVLWPLILINPMSVEGGYSFFNYMRLEPLRISPRIQKSDTKTWSWPERQERSGSVTEAPRLTMPK